MKLTAARLAFAFALVLTLLSPADGLAQGHADEQGSTSIGLGYGIVDAGDTADYLTANIRFPLGRRSSGAESASAGGFIEPEIGYWQNDGARHEATDTLVGVNVGGMVRLRVFEYFIGGGIGYHMIEVSGRRPNGLEVDTDDGVIGLNAQFGFGVRLSDVVSLFGVGRYDLVNESDDHAATLAQLGAESAEHQTKAILGVRIYF